MGAHTLEELCALLEEYHDEMFVTAAFIAVYLTAIQTIVIIPGDYREWSEDECNQLLQRWVCHHFSKMN